MLAFWAVAGVVVFFDLFFWLLEKVPPPDARLWPETDEELRDRHQVRQRYRSPAMTTYRVRTNTTTRFPVILPYHNGR